MLSVEVICRDGAKRRVDEVDVRELVAADPGFNKQGTSGRALFAGRNDSAGEGAGNCMGKCFEADWTPPLILAVEAIEGPFTQRGV